MRVLSVVGARPQFVKLAPVAEALRVLGHQHVVVHTGQHYDPRMSASFFDQFALGEPDVQLGVGSGPHGQQTGRMLEKLEEVIDDNRADWVLVYGDTNSTLAGALAAVKLGRPVAHLEAGLRSFNRAMPEEHNRVLTDHASDLLLAPTTSAMHHLDVEGLGSRAVLVGDVMADVCLRVAAQVPGRRPAELRAVVGEEPYVLATLHRQENTDDPARLSGLLAALRAIDLPVVLSAHPRLVARASAAGVDLAGGAVRPVEPFGYPDLVAALAGARAVVTDSGGLQKEAYLVGTPCTTLRTETEWPETLDGGWNVLAPAPVELGPVALRERPSETRGTPFGDGRAATFVVRALEKGSGGALTP